MEGTFACPECGCELELKGTTPGRQVRCGWCETWVEVPFLPRAAAPPQFRRRRGRPPWVRWAWIGLGVAAALIVLAGADRLIRTRSRRHREQAVARLLASAEAEEKAGQLAQALEHLDRALKEAARSMPPRPERVEAVRRQRDRVAGLEAQLQLEAARQADPSHAIATYKALLARTWKDPALAGYEATIRDRLAQTRRRWAEADEAAARQAISAGQPNEAIDRCERAFETADELPDHVRHRIQAEADSLVGALIRRRGVVFDTVQGSFTLGSPQSYQAALFPRLEAVFRKHDYVPRRATSRWVSVWDDQSPFRVAVSVHEHQEGSYLHTPNRLSFLEANITLTREGISAWQSGAQKGHTKASIPSVSAFTASRLELNDRPSPDFERILYDDARETLIANLATRLRTVPDCRPTAE